MRRMGAWTLGIALPSLLWAAEPGWQNPLWNDDQRGAYWLEQQRPIRAAQTFRDPEWQGVAHYRAGRYAEAVRSLARRKGPRAQYNRANALMQLGEYSRAARVYQRILKAQPEHADAAHNLEIAEQLMRLTGEPPPPETPRAEGESSRGANNPPPQNPRSDPGKAQAQRRESAQARAQWMRQIEDDPSSLLKRQLKAMHLRMYPQVTDALEPW